MPHDHAIWWHVYPLTATGAPIRGASEADAAPRLRRLDAWLDYVADLGCTGLLLGPIFDSVSHGYDTIDHLRIDPRLGGDAEFDHLIAEAGRRGLAVVLDGVFNHVAETHRFVGEGLTLGGWEGHGELRTLNHADPRVQDYVVEVMLHWLRRGIAGWRLDVAYAVPTWFWRTVTERVRAEFPDALFIGEVLHGDYPAFLDASALDTLTQYELWKATWSSIYDANFFELAHALGRHAEFSAGRVLQTFVGNHDVTRIASRVGDAGAALAATLLFTLPGMPSVYYGDEQGFRGEKGEGFGADDDLRPALPDSPDALARDGWWLHSLYRGLIALRRANPWLTRGNVVVTEKSNTAIAIEVRGEGHLERVDVWLSPTPGVRVTIDGVQAFEWSDALAHSA